MAPQARSAPWGYPRPLGRSPTLLLTLGIPPSTSRIKTRTQTCLSQLCLMQANNDINSPNQRHLTWPSAQASCHEKWALTCRPGVGSGPESQGPWGRVLPKEGTASSASAVKQQPHHRPWPLRQGSGTCSSTLSQRARPSTIGPHPPPSTNTFCLN